MFKHFFRPFKNKKSTRRLFGGFVRRQALANLQGVDVFELGFERGVDLMTCGLKQKMV